jgi:5'-methylthioadenosine phosphorylase
MNTTVSDPTRRADLGVIGGSGFYSFLADATPVRVTTPYGDPSDDIVVGELDGRRVAFLARHGQGHRFPPHRVNYRANLWALRAVGVRQVISPCAVGSLVAENGPGTVVVPDQIIDRTWGRPHTLYDDEGQVVHVGFADPFCPVGRGAAIAAGVAAGRTVVPEGTLVVINGQRFSSRAEAAWHRQMGATIVGMTTMPEAAIARELALCFTTVSLVTDLDAGVGGDDSVTHAGVLEIFAANMKWFKAVIRDTIARLPDVQGGSDASTPPLCSCAASLDGIEVPFELPS